MRSSGEPQYLKCQSRAALVQVRLVHRGPDTGYLLFAFLGTPETFLGLLAIPFEINRRIVSPKVSLSCELSQLASHISVSKTDEVGTSLAVQWLRLCLPMQGVRVRSLVGELRSHMPRDQKTKT